MEPGEFYLLFFIYLCAPSNFIREKNEKYHIYQKAIAN